MRICNLHFFAPIWMAQSILHNFRRISMAALKPREPGFFDYKEGWYKWDGKGKHEEETFSGHTMGCVRLMITHNNVEPFHYHNWGPIEHFASHSVMKDSIWNARRELSCNDGCVYKTWRNQYEAEFSPFS